MANTKSVRVSKPKTDPIKHYINNKEFLLQITLYKKDIVKAIKKKESSPRMPEYIGECIYQIATNLSFRPNFINYTFKDEMISDGIENAVKYLTKFDEIKYKNPFGYFTTIIWWAFIRRIYIERENSYIKYKSMENMQLDLDEMLKNHNTNDFKIHTGEFIEEFERKNSVGKKTTKPKKAVDKAIKK